MFDLVFCHHCHCKLRDVAVSCHQAEKSDRERLDAVGGVSGKRRRESLDPLVEGCHRPIKEDWTLTKFLENLENDLRMTVLVVDVDHIVRSKLILSSS